MRGFAVENAIGEGILLTSVNDMTVRDNHVTMNDKGAHTSVYPPCADNGPVPGDCGEAIHLQGTTNSKIVFNRVDHNIGGILVTDESGPTTGNLIASNRVTDNTGGLRHHDPVARPGSGREEQRREGELRRRERRCRRAHRDAGAGHGRHRQPRDAQHHPEQR